MFAFKYAVFVISAFAHTTGLLANNTDEKLTNWQVRVEVDPFSGQVDGGASISNTNGDKLSFACNGLEESILSVQFLPRRFLGSKENMVLVKFDDVDPLPGAGWEYTSKGAYTVIKAYVDAFSSLTSGDGQTILVRALNYENQPIDARFESINARAAINKLRAACGEPEI